MPVHGSVENFIPFRRADLVALCAGEGRLGAEDAGRFRTLARLVEALYHHEFHERLERLKEAFAPYDPDADTRPVGEKAEAEREAGLDGLVRVLEEVLHRANYEKVPAEDLDRALEERSLIPFDIKVDSNAGVFRTVVDEAEEEEGKEAMLAYYHLLAGGPAAASGLDRRIEAWFASRLGAELDFEISDALGKLAKLELVRRDGNRFCALPFPTPCAAPTRSGTGSTAPSRDHASRTALRNSRVRSSRGSLKIRDGGPSSTIRP